MDFDLSKISGDNGDCDMLEEEHETIYLNDIVWVHVKKSIWLGRVMQIPFSDRKDDSEYTKIRYIDTKKEDKVLINNVSLYYSKK